MYKFRLSHGIGPGERNDRHDLAGFGASLERATGLDPWLPHAWPMAAFSEAHTSDGYMPGFGGAVRGFQIFAGLDPDGVARSGGPTENALAATLDPNRRGRTVTADEVYRGAPSAAATVPTDRPADGGVKAAAKIRKLSQQTAGPGATGAGKGGAGANRRPTIPTVPPPGVRQSVGAGGVNDHGDLLQARRNLARLGYVPRIAGIGEPDGGLAAVQNGLRAYQQARGIKVDGLMNPGGATERALHRQIGRQQKRLIEQVATDAAEAAAKLSAGGWSGNAGAIGGPESVAARTLGARMTGAKVEAQQREAYAEALDRMEQAGAGKGAEAGAANGKGAQADATGGVTAVAGDVPAKAPGEIRIDEVPGRTTAAYSEPEKPAPATAGAERTRADRSAAKPRPGRGHPLMREQPAYAARREEARERAETDKHASLGNIEHEAERVERRRRRRAAEEAYRKGRQSGLDAAGNLLRSIDIAIEHGALPRRFLPLFRHMAGAGRRLQADRYIAVLDRLAQLHDERRTVFDTLPPRLRTAVAVHRHLAARDGRLDPADRSDDNQADLRRRSSLVRSIANELDRSEALRTLGFAADWTPVIGEFKSGIEALIALHNYAEARKRGDLKAAAHYGEEAAWAFVGAAPGLGYSRKGRKLLRQLASPVGKLSVEAANALARKIEDAAAKRQPKRKVEDEPEELPKNFESGQKREFSERLAARSKLSILRLYAKISKREKLGLDDVFSEGMLGLDKEQRKIASIVVAGAKGKAAESRVKGLMQDSGFVTATKESGRAVTTKDKGQRRYDIATTDKFSSFLGLFVFPGAYKATVRNNRTVQIEVKSGGGKKKPRQYEIDEDVKEAARRGNPKKVANRKDGLVIVDVVDLQMPTHWIDKEAFAGNLRGPLTGKFGRLRTDAFLRDLDEFYRRSTDKTPIPFGVVLLYLAGRLPRLDDDEPDGSQ